MRDKDYKTEFEDLKTMRSNKPSKPPKIKTPKDVSLQLDEAVELQLDLLKEAIEMGREDVIIDEIESVVEHLLFLRDVDGLDGKKKEKKK